LYSQIEYDEFYVAIGLSGTEPTEWAPLKEYKDIFNPNATASDDILVDIANAGIYEIAIIPTKLTNLEIFSASLKFTPLYDVHLKSVESPASFARLTPKDQVEGTKTFNVVLQNTGTSAVSGTVHLTLDEDETPAASAPFAFSTAGEEKTIPLSTVIPSLPVGALNLNFTAEITGHEDVTPENNTVQITKLISDSTYAWDNTDVIALAIGHNAPLAFGLIYELEKKDVLTSINLGFLGNETITDNFGLAVYPVDDDLMIGEPVLYIEHARGAGSWYSLTFDVPDTELEAGKYFFAAKQLTAKRFNIGVDSSPGGYFYYTDYTEGEALQVQSDGHYLHIRPNFGELHTGITEVKAAAPELTVYPNPVSDVLSVNVANQRIERISVYNASGIEVYQNSRINSSEYKLNTCHLASGFYFITVQTNARVSTAKFIVK
jgi:hypothetical protein